MSECRTMVNFHTTSLTRYRTQTSDRWRIVEGSRGWACRGVKTAAAAATRATSTIAGLYYMCIDHHAEDLTKSHSYMRQRRIVYSRRYSLKAEAGRFYFLPTTAS